MEASLENTHGSYFYIYLYTYTHTYTLLKDNPEKYSFLCFKFYCFLEKKLTLKKDHIKFTLQSSCLPYVYSITVVALFNVFSSYFPAQELFQIKKKEWRTASPTLNSSPGSHRGKDIQNAPNTHSFPHQLAAALHKAGLFQKKVIEYGPGYLINFSVW